MLIVELQVNGIEPHPKLQVRFGGGLNIITGPNNSGKTTLLYVLAKVLGLTASTDDKRELVADNRGTIEVRLAFQAKGDEIFGSQNDTTLALSMFKGHVIQAARERGFSMWYDYRGQCGEDRAVRSSNTTASSVFVGDINLFDQSNLEGSGSIAAVANRTQKYFARYAELLHKALPPFGIRLVSWITSPAVDFVRHHEVMRKLRDGSETRYGEFVRRLKEFHNTFPELRHTAEKIFAIIGKRQDESDIMIPFEQEGGGSLRATMILTEMFLLRETWIRQGSSTPRVEPILLIDEPEVSMHPGLQRKIFKELVEFSEHAQVFISTHSPIFTMPNDRSTIIIMPLARTGADVIYPTREDVNRIRLSLGVENRDILLHSAALFVEGASEEEFLKVLLEDAKVDLFANGIVLKNMEGVDYFKDTFIQSILELTLVLGLNVSIETDNENEVAVVREKLTPQLGSFIENRRYEWHLCDPNFEAEFPPEWLYNALRCCAEDHKGSLKLTPDEFGQRLSKIKKEMIPREIEKVYWDTLSKGLSKRRFGYHLGRITLENRAEARNIPVVQFFTAFFGRYGPKLLP